MSRLRADNVQGFSAETQGRFVTWGGRQNVSVRAVSGPGTYVFPRPDPPVAGVFPIRELKQFDQLVDMRYARPTTWQINLFSEAQFEMDPGNELRMLWDVFTSVGKASNKLRIETLFTKGAVIPGFPFAQSVFFTQQIAAQTIQIQPEALAIDISSASITQTVSWSAWVAPVVD